MRSSDAGFTLLEVMAAVAVLAIVFTTLARLANQGLQSEGISKRRFEASLLADSVLADIEAQISTGTAPESGRTEFEEGKYAVAVDVTDFNLASVIPASDAVPETETDSAVPYRPPSLVGDTSFAVRKIEIAVTWTEGLNEFRVTRSSFGFDRASVQGLVDTLDLVQ